MDKDIIEDFSVGLAFEIVNHDLNEVAEPTELAKIIEKFITEYFQ